MGLNINLYYGSIIMIIVSTLLYHVAQKSIPSDINPIMSMIITYLSALLICIAAYPFIKQGSSFIHELRKANWAVFALGLAVLGIEIGFLYAYRSGWNISRANLFSSSIIVVLLIPIGIHLYNEAVSFTNAIGVILCMVGVSLINR